MSDESRARGVTATVKYSKDYDAPWVVFHGSVSEIKEDMGVWFGQEEAAKELDGHDLLTGLYNAFKSQGGGSARRGNSRGSEDVVEPAKPVSAELVEARPVAVTDEGLVEKIKAAKSVDEITALWKAQPKAFEDAKVQKAAKERNAELTKK